MGTIRPVPKRKQLQAIEHLVAGGPCASWQHLSVQGLWDALCHQGRRREHLLYWSLEGKAIRATVMILVSQGRVGFLYHSPPDGPEVDREALIELVDHVSKLALQRQMSMVQMFLDETMVDYSEILEPAGFSFLTELHYMKYDLPAATIPTESNAEQANHLWSFQTVQHCGLGVLKQLVPRTYQETQDCPALSGRRDIDDIIASHQSAGQYTPNWWWIAFENGQPVGCILLNRIAHDGAELVYMGVAPAYRRRGLGKALLQQGVHCVQLGDKQWIRVAVDGANTPAIRLYEHFGFVDTSQRVCWVRFKTAPQ